MQNEYDDYDNYDSPPFRWMSVVVLLLAVAGFFSLAWYAYYTGTKHVEYDEVATIEAGDAPIKVEPDEAGGMEFPHQDKTIYEATSDEEVSAPATAKLMEKPEEPVVPKDMPAETVESKEKKVTAIIQKAVKDAQEELEANGGVKETKPEVVVKKVEKSEPAKVIQKEVAAPAPKVEAKKVEPPKPAAPKATAKPQTLVKKEEPKPAPKPAPKKEVVKKPAAKPVPTASVSGAMNHLLQLGAYRSVVEAEKNWTRINRSNVDLLDKKPYKIVRADLGSKGVYHRLRVGGFDTASAAKSVCDKLKTRKQPCFLVK